MTNAEKVNQYLTETGFFTFLTTDGDQPKGRPFGMHLLYDNKVIFGCGTFKNVYKQMKQNPKVAVIASKKDEFLRYEGIATEISDDGLMAKVREMMPDIMYEYDRNGYRMCLFYLDHGHAEIRGMTELKEEFFV